MHAYIVSTSLAITCYLFNVGTLTPLKQSSIGVVFFSRDLCVHLHA